MVILDRLYVARAVDVTEDGSLHVRSRWHVPRGLYYFLGWVCCIALLQHALLTYGGLGVQMSDLFFPAMWSTVVIFSLERRSVCVDVPGRRIVVRDAGLLDKQIARYELPFSAVRGVGTLDVYPQEARASGRMITLHLADSDRYLISVTGHWRSRDVEERLRAAILGSAAPPHRTPLQAPEALVAEA